MKHMDIQLNSTIIDIQLSPSTEEQSFSLLLADETVLTYRFKVVEAEAEAQEESITGVQKKSKANKKVDKLFCGLERKADLRELANRSYNGTKTLDPEVKFNEFVQMRLRGKLYFAVLSSDNCVM
jgi:hypothetical protein